VDSDFEKKKQVKKRGKDCAENGIGARMGDRCFRERRITNLGLQKKLQDSSAARPLRAARVELSTWVEERSRKYVRYYPPGAFYSEKMGGQGSRSFWLLKETR